MNKNEIFDEELQDLALFAKAISHPARLAILNFLAEQKICISGDISDYLPLSRTTVSQHLKVLKNLGIIHGEIEGLKINYCLCNDQIIKYVNTFKQFFGKIESVKIECLSSDKC
ncbi:MAG: ArsR/SmtB family transcription factor [Bacteroidales bacterium]